ncbi:hypothetical protein QJS04_geneDACA025093 [Acorus gramineus]|uniref:BLOC-1-related complex subunit 5 n=1 Tax=Acorus gramineus TaxID=55184 RepID=A0AAV9A167_ACOGR|nr:hypothetical protein QJS04_geneDACA025093 [Acorus gramineus]
MGTAESVLSSSRHHHNQQPPADEITTISERTEGVDPLVERLRSLKIVTLSLSLASPLLASASPTESSLTDILVKKQPSSSLQVGSLDPNVLLELFSMYRDWQEERAKAISQTQGEIENKIEIADALAVKLLQRFNYSVSAMRIAANNLSEVQQLQVEVGELKGRLTEVLSNCDALCKMIVLEGPETLRSSVKPFSTGKIETPAD